MRKDRLCNINQKKIIFVSVMVYLKPKNITGNKGEHHISVSPIYQNVKTILSLYALNNKN
jgi:hypothetical protein